MINRRFIIIGLLTAGIAAFTASAVQDLWRAREEARTLLTFPGTEEIEAYQLRNDLERFLRLASAFVQGDRAVAQSNVIDSFDILWSRTSTMLNGPIYREFYGEAQLDQTAGDLFAFLKQIDPTVLNLQRQSVDELRTIIEGFLPHEEAIRGLSVDGTHRATDRLSKVRDDLEVIHRQITTSATGLIVCLLLIAAAFAREYRRSQTMAEELAAREAQARYIAEHDVLTGLLNRHALNQQISRMVDQRDGSQSAALLLIEIDNFQSANDRFGHSSGDQILREIAKRLASVTVEGDFLARLGGDGFGILRTHDPKTAKVRRQDLNQLAGRINDLISMPINLEEQNIQLSASIGIAWAEEYDGQMIKLMSKADLALYRAKKEGGNAIRFFDATAYRAVAEERAIATDLRRAMEDNDLEVFFQPKIDLQQRVIAGAEALVRWHHPERGWISPQKFVDIAEKNGLILDLGQWVLNESCRMAASWTGEAAKLPVAVNVSPVQFTRQDMIRTVEQALEVNQLEAERLSLEITESVLMHDTDAAGILLNVLHDMGVSIALDDFGTGYSNLHTLRMLAIDDLKIDQAFVRDLENNMDDRAIVETILSLASHLKLRVIAEGVETNTQEDFLRDHGCLYAQGFLFSRPVCEREFLNLLNSWSTGSRPPWSGSKPLPDSYRLSHT